MMSGNSDFHLSSFLFKNVLVLIFIILNVYLSNCVLPKIPGQFRKLGSHREALGITWAGVFSAPVVFYQNFVEPGKPIIMKEVLQQTRHPGLVNWTDHFLSQKFGSEHVKVEKSKKENRALSYSFISLKEFLNTYQTEDVYMVHTLRNKMEELVLIPRTLQCGGFQKVIQEAVMWMGSHTTSSVLHKDPLDNLLCVLNGRKDIVLIDKAHMDDVEKDGFDHNGDFSTVDPQHVDFDNFPRLAHVNWHEARLGKGDCLFIPQGWYHQVTSGGYRHVSINLWFSHLWWFNASNCHNDISIHKPLEPISTFGFASPNEAYRSKFLSHFKNKGILSRYRFHELLPTNPTEERADEFFNAINEFPDGALSWSELYSFDIDKILPQFWDLFNISGTQNVLNPMKASNEDEVVNEANAFDKNHKQDTADDSFLKNVDIVSVKKNDESTVEVNHVEASLPLPDAMSGDSPSLPDNSGDSLISRSTLHQDASNLNNEDVSQGTKDLDEFCSEENGCEENALEALNHFTESSNEYLHSIESDQEDDNDVDISEPNKIRKGSRDEL